MRSIVKGIFKTGKTIFIGLAIYITVIGLFFTFSNPKQYALKASAIDTQTAPLYALFNDPKNNRTKEQRLINAAYKFFGCRAIGEFCTSTPPSNPNKYFSGSMLGGASHLMAMTYMSPPASGVAWAYSGLQNAGIAPRTYAAEGIGLAGIQPLSKIWLLFRNTTYLLLTLLIVTIGLLIMFRFNVNPQTIVTLENSLPRIIITLILITFSFAIAGFMIDVMYMVILMTISVFSSVDPQHFDPSQLNRHFVTASFATLWDGFFPSSNRFLNPVNPINIFGQFTELANLGAALLDVLPNVINGTVRTFGTLGIAWGAYKIMLSGQEGIAKPLVDALKNQTGAGFGLGDLPGSIAYLAVLGLMVAVIIPFTMTFGGGWILAIIIFFTLVLLFFRIIVMLFATYLRIILYIIFAPFMILTTAIPGRNGFVGWIRSLAAELAVFPTVIILLLVGRMLVTVFQTANAYSGSKGVASPGLWTPPFLWGIGSRSIAIIIAMQMIFLIPDLTRMVKTKISGKQALPFRTGAGVFFGGASGAFAGGLAGVSQVSGIRTMLYGPGAGLLGSGGKPAAMWTSARGRLSSLRSVWSGGNKPAGP